MMINQKGQSLVEVLIALGVATIVVSAMAVAAITSVNNADFSKYQNVATQYAQEGIEVVRQKSQTDWTTFRSTYVGEAPDHPTGLVWCLDQGTTMLDASPLSGCAKNIRDQNSRLFFVRDVTLTATQFIAYTTPNVVHPACNGTVQATVRVAWTDGKCSGPNDYCHAVVLNSCFTNLNTPGQ